MLHAFNPNFNTISQPSPVLLTSASSASEAQ